MNGGEGHAAEGALGELGVHLGEPLVRPLAAGAGSLDRSALQSLPGAPEAVTVEPGVGAEALVAGLAEAVEEDGDGKALFGLEEARQDEEKPPAALVEVEHAEVSRISSRTSAVRGADARRPRWRPGRGGPAAGTTTPGDPGW